MMNKTHMPSPGLRAPRPLLPRCSNRLTRVYAAMSPSSSPSPEDSDATSRRNEPKAVALDPSDPTSQLVAKAMYKEDLADNAAVQLPRRPVLGLLGLGGVAGAAGLWTIKSEQQRSSALLRYRDEASMPLATALALTLDAAGYMSTVRAQLMTMVRQMRAGFRADSSFREEGVSSPPLERLLLADALILHLSNLEQALPVLGAQAAYGQPDASIFSLNIGDAPRDRQCERLTVEGLYLLRRAKSVLLSMRKAQAATLSETRDFINTLTPAMKNVDQLLGYLPPVQS